MSAKIETIIQRIRDERLRQFDLPGSEWDAHNTPGDWTSLVSHYATEEVRRNGIAPNATDFEDSLIKAAAVILATLEYTEEMKERGDLL